MLVYICVYMNVYIGMVVYGYVSVYACVIVNSILEIIAHKCSYVVSASVNVKIGILISTKKRKNKTRLKFPEESRRPQRPKL